jgi:16S rRNA (cytosine967-C5)-methyltransferase
MANDLAARTAALKLLQAVLQKHRSIDDSFDVAARGLEPRDRAFARMLTATCLRRLGQIDVVLQHFVNRIPPDPVLDLLRLGTAQLLFLGTPPHAAVATTVALVKTRQAKFAGLANAVLRRVSEQGAGIVAAHNAAQVNTPEWLWQSWLGAYGEAATQATASAHLHEAPLDLTLKDPDAADVWAERLGATVLPGGSLRMPAEHARLQELPGFSEGAWWVQDAAAAIPARALLAAVGPGPARIADLCAAPGGKTAQLARAGHHVTAVDISAERLALVRQNMDRLQLKADIVAADALMWNPTDPFDAVLLDAPCSATGTIRRHPDLPYLKRAGDLAGFASLQVKLLKAAAARVKPGGLIFYSVCSLQRDERRCVVDAVLGADPALSLLKIPLEAVGGEHQLLTDDGELRTLPSQWADRGGLDGFYGALIRRG